jgi:hypothetical protein
MRRFSIQNPERLWTVGPAVFGLMMALITALGVSGVSEAESKMLLASVAVELKPTGLTEQASALSAHGLELTR